MGLQSSAQNFFKNNLSKNNRYEDIIASNQKNVKS